MRYSIYARFAYPLQTPQEVDFEKLATDTDDKLKELEQFWYPILDANVDQNNRQGCFRTGLLKLAFSYARLIALSYGFQHAFGKNSTDDENPFLKRCLNAATDVVKAMVEDIGKPEQSELLFLSIRVNVADIFQCRNISPTWTRSTKCFHNICSSFPCQSTSRS